MKVEKTIKLDIPLIEDIIFIQSSGFFLYHVNKFPLADRTTQRSI